jgi:hypothetical protein
VVNKFFLCGLGDSLWQYILVAALPRCVLCGKKTKRSQFSAFSIKNQGSPKKQTQFFSGLSIPCSGLFAKQTDPQLHRGIIQNGCEGPMEQDSSIENTKRSQIIAFSIKKQGSPKKRTQFHFFYSWVPWALHSWVLASFLQNEPKYPCLQANIKGCQKNEPISNPFF